MPTVCLIAMKFGIQRVLDMAVALVYITQFLGFGACLLFIPSHELITHRRQIVNIRPFLDRFPDDHFAKVDDSLAIGRR